MESAADWPPLIPHLPLKSKVAQFCAAPWPNFAPPLTNRRALEAALAQAVDTVEKGGRPFALMHLDLDFFKSVNDMLGHAAGDHVLTEVARVLREETRRDDIIARVGGDKFVLILSGLVDEGKLVALAERIIERIEEPILFEGRSCRVSGSAGIAISTSYRLQNPYRMLSDSDLALYASKRGGRGRATVFRPDLVLTNDRRARH
ncbi:MAG: GGDEF domain-containing protein [Proteobacteria bacterium]|nr:GGDEF domain-containing protein [Pseudomonadota bacterium]